MGSLQKLSREHTHIHTDARTPYSGDGGSGSGSGSGGKEEEQQGGEKKKENEGPRKPGRNKKKSTHFITIVKKLPAARHGWWIDRPFRQPCSGRFVRSFVRHRHRQRCGGATFSNYATSDDELAALWWSKRSTSPRCHFHHGDTVEGASQWHRRRQQSQRDRPSVVTQHCRCCNRVSTCNDDQATTATTPAALHACIPAFVRRLVDTATRTQKDTHRQSKAKQGVVANNNNDGDGDDDDDGSGM